MANDKIIIKGAREHNLKNVSLTLPREKLIVMTGLSGSGKSSLAFDTIYADGQRRYVESLSSYARMFLGRMDKPDVDEITGLSPAISIDQKTTSHNPRSTVGTVTEIYDYLRLLYARIGIPHCPVCGRVISQQTVDEMVDAVLKLEEGTKFQVLAPVVRQRKGTQQKELDAARRGGYSRVRIDGNLYDLDEEISLEKNVKHTVEIVVDRLAIRKGIRGRLADSLETALALTGGIAEVDVIGGECMTFSQNFACPEHGISISDLSPRLFSFNNPLGACEKCTGLGTFMRVDEERILPNRNLSIREGAVKASGWYYAEGSVAEMYYLGLGKKYGFTLDTPIKEMSTEAINALLYGTNGEKIEMHRTNEFGSGVYHNTFEGIVENLERRFRETNSEWMKEEIGSFMSGVECPGCHGKRLKPIVLAVTIGGKNISDFCEMSIRRPDSQRNQKPAAVFAERRSGLSHPGPRGRHSVRRREPAHPPDDPDRQRPFRCALCAGRALHRPPSAGQQQAHCHPEKPAGPGQYGHRGGTRRGYHAQCGLYCGCGPRRGRPRRRDRGGWQCERHLQGQAEHYRRLSLGP